MLEIPDGNWWDWDVVAWDGARFVIGSNYDLSYSHSLELVFTDPVYVQCPALFHDPVFREPTPEEERLVRRTGEPFPVLVAFEAECGCAPMTGLIAAGGLEIVTGPVLRYWRDDADMEPGWRRAPWVTPPASSPSP
ncbi:hypothetical protein [Catenulispora pinisilvae]|uniref:hypothetical protein n=1 Tax=Catenulispora pinisilvae TaxID=2705253 RepID=UPI0018918DBA|nr:hypothetical protein [Catenulispora pinisilvae]